MGLEALGAIAGGINKGMDWTQRDQEIKDQRAWREQQQAAWQEDREFQGGQRQRTIEEQGRSDKLREELGKIPQAGTEFTVPGTDVGPMEDGSATPGVKKTQTAIARAKQEGTAFQQAGDYKTAAERFKWANEEASKAAANSAVRALNSLPKEASLHDIVSAVAPVVDGDDSPVGIKTISKGEDGKSVRVQLYNKITGVTQEQDFADVPSLKRALTYHYAPDYAMKMDEQTRAAELKTEKVGPGETLLRGNTPVYTNTTESPTVTAARIRQGGAGATGVGAGTRNTSAKPTATNESQAIDLVKDLLTAEEDKPYRLAAANNIEWISKFNSSSNLPPAVIAHAAATYAKTPAAATVTFDPNTGWGKAVDVQGRRVVVNDAVTREEIKAAAPAQADSLYAQLKAENSPLLSVVKDPTKVDALANEQIRANAMKLAAATGRSNTDKAVWDEARAVFDSQTRPKITQTLDLLSQSELAKKDAKPDAGKSGPGFVNQVRTRFSGGLGPSYTPPADSPVGQMRARSEAQAAERKSAEAAKQAETQKLSDAASQKAKPIIEARDIRAAFALQGSEEFKYLPQQDKLAIYKIVNGGR